MRNAVAYDAELATYYASRACGHGLYNKTAIA